MSTYVSVVISPETRIRPVFTSVSQATRPAGSSASTASRTPSEIWSAILSGWPSVTDSEVKSNSLSDSCRVVIRRGSLAARNGRTVHERDALLVLHAEHRVADPDRVERPDRGRAGGALAELGGDPVLVVVLLEPHAGERLEPGTISPPVRGYPGALELQRGAALGLDHREVRDRGSADVRKSERVPDDLARLALEDALPAGPEGGVEAKWMRGRVTEHVGGHQR